MTICLMTIHFCCFLTTHDFITTFILLETHRYMTHTHRYMKKHRLNQHLFLAYPLSTHAIHSFFQVRLVPSGAVAPSIPWQHPVRHMPLPREKHAFAEASFEKSSYYISSPIKIKIFNQKKRKMFFWTTSLKIQCFFV